MEALPSFPFLAALDFRFLASWSGEIRDVLVRQVRHAALNNLLRNINQSQLTLAVIAYDDWSESKLLQSLKAAHHPFRASTPVRVVGSLRKYGTLI